MIEMPVGAEIIHLDVQNGIPRIWVVVDPNEEKFEEREFALLGTGHSTVWEWVGKESHVGTFLTNPFVFHLFEMKK